MKLETNFFSRSQVTGEFATRQRTPLDGTKKLIMDQISFDSIQVIGTMVMNILL